MGDSIAAGQGGRWNGNTDNGQLETYVHRGTSIYGDTWNWVDGSHNDGDGCHRSDTAAIHGIPGNVVHINMGCSGAETKHVWLSDGTSNGGQSYKGENTQANQLSYLANQYDVKAITLTVGANDVNWGDLVKRCIERKAYDDLPFEDLGPCNLDEDVPNRVATDTLLPNLDRAINDIVNTMSGAGYADGSYRIIVQSYIGYIPNITEIDTTKGYCNALYPADMQWLKTRVMPRLIGALHNGVQRLRASKPSVKIQFLDRYNAFKGHELCSTQAGRLTTTDILPMEQAEWAVKLYLAVPTDWERGRIVESFHPNAYGQRATQSCLAQMYAFTTGDYQCTAVGAGSAQVTVSPMPTVWSTNGTTVMPNTWIPKGTCITSPDGQTRLCFDADGDLRLYRNGQVRWDTGTTGVGMNAYYSPAGHLVVFDANWNNAWASANSWGNPSSQLVVGNDTVRIYNIAGLALWAAPVSVPNVLHQDPTAATDILTAAGFTVARNSAPDSTCNDIGMVMSQSPSNSSRLVLGSTVTITIGTMPTTPCP